MSGVDKRWQLFPSSPDLAQRLSASLSCDVVVSQLLLNRGIRSLQVAENYLNPHTNSIPQFPDDMLDPAVDILKKAIEKKEPILVFGDYDVDGVTSTSIFLLVLRALGANVTYRIPNRFTDGYGVSKRVVDEILSDQFSVFITLDCGISNANEMTLIKSKTSTSIIILDHHTIPDILPPADAIINPMALPNTSPLYGLCTAGIAYKFMEYFCKKAGYNYPVHELLDLAAIGTVADVAPLVGENRRITTLGLVDLTARKRHAINLILDIAKFKREQVTSRDIGFTIAPRLNAAGRLGNAGLGVELLTTDDASVRIKLAHQLEDMNQDRRQIGEFLMAEAISVVENDQRLHDSHVLVMSGQGWHAGVIGIIASRLVDKFSKPVVMVAEQDAIARGSARSIGDVNIYQVLKTCTRYFDTFGGHKEAAGFSINLSQIDDFKSALIDISRSEISKEALRPILDIDMAITPDQITLGLAKTLDTLAPFGQRNPMPLFYTNGLKAIDSRTVGDGSHLKVTFADQQGHKIIDAIGFGLAEKLPLIQKDQTELAFHIGINAWNGNENVQMELVDIK